MKSSIFSIVIIAVLFSGCSFGSTEEDKIIISRENSVVREYANNSDTNESNSETDKKGSSDLREPLLDAAKRINKKPFGLFITPENSPVQSERFSGYHTGTDFEIFTEELEDDVFIFAICSGNIESKQIIDGYGGVIIQSCIINDEDVHVLYGHVSLPKASVTAGSDVAAGEKISILGAHESVETDGERKHLHLGIIKGDRINFRGYVQDDNELVQWISYEQLVLNK